MGIAFQSLKNEDTENISYIIPTPVIEHVSCKLVVSEWERVAGRVGAVESDPTPVIEHVSSQRAAFGCCHLLVVQRPGAPLASSPPLLSNT